MSQSELANLELIPLVAGNLGVAGAPILHLSLLFNTVTGNVNGEAVITQAVAAPYDRIVVPNLTGKVESFTLPPGETLFVTLQGEYTQSFPPPAIGQILCHFNATLVVDPKWNGRASFSYENHKVSNVPVALAR